MVLNLVVGASVGEIMKTCLVSAEVRRFLMVISLERSHSDCCVNSDSSLGMRGGFRGKGFHRLLQGRERKVA